METGKQSLNKIQKTLSSSVRFVGVPQTLTVTNAALSLSEMVGYVAPPESADYVLIEVQDASTGGIRFGFGTVGPTIAVGLRKFNKDTFDIENPSDIQNFKAILGAVGVCYLNLQFGIKR